MTQPEFDASLAAKRKASIEEWNAAGNKGFPPTTGAHDTVASRTALAEEAGYVLPRDANRVMAKDYHRLVVEAAVKQGRPVPREVLAEYPDLVPAPKPHEGRLTREQDPRIVELQAEADHLRAALGREADAQGKRQVAADVRGGINTDLPGTSDGELLAHIKSVASERGGIARTDDKHVPELALELSKRFKFFLCELSLFDYFNLDVVDYWTAHLLHDIFGFVHVAS
jgi:hypothetical protein